MSQLMGIREGLSLDIGWDESVQGEDPEDHDSWSGRGSSTAGLTAVCGRHLLQGDEGGDVGLTGQAEGLFVCAWSGRQILTTFRSS